MSWILAPFRIFFYFGEGVHVAPRGLTKALVSGISVAMTAYIGWYAAFGESDLHLHDAIFLAGVLPIVFLTVTARPSRREINAIDWLWAAASVLGCLYFIWNNDFYSTLIEGITRISTIEIVMSLVMTCLVIEASRRSIGWGLSGVAIAGVIYVAFGQYLGGALGHDPISLDFYARRITVSDDALFGVTVEVAATYGFLFVFFGSLYHRAGGGQFFFDLSRIFVGGLTGGATKACVLSSGAYGSVSGSPTADVMTTGAITIPIMRRAGATAVRAAATEAAASCGGSMVPPVMGSVAFLMAQFTGISYRDIAFSAISVAVLYYFGVLSITHLEASYVNEGRLEQDSTPSLVAILRSNLHLLLPLAGLIYLITLGYSPMIVAAGASVVAIFASYLTTRRELWITPAALLDCCTETLTRITNLAAACAAAGLVIGYLDMSGLVGKFSFIISMVSGGSLVITLLASAVLLFILGLGLPTAAVYIMGAALIGPILVAQYGVPVLQAHMFMLVHSCMSAVTPPLAVAAMASAALAGANPDEVGWKACRLAYFGFVLPFIIVLHPSVLLTGSVADIVLAVAGAFVAAVCLGYAIAGTIGQRRLSPAIRIGFLVLGLALILPGYIYQVASLAAAVAAIALLWRWDAASRPAEAPRPTMTPDRG